MSLKGLARIAALYGQVERVRLVELQQAAASVAEAERLRTAAVEDGAVHQGAGRAALAEGEGHGWRLAQDACQAAHEIAARAEELRAERDVVRASAGESYRASRRQTAQLVRVVAGLVKAETLLEERREQAAADDRFAARLCWSRMKAG